MSKGVLDVTGSNVATFCDDLIKDSKTYADIYQESVNQFSGVYPALPDMVLFS